MSGGQGLGSTSVAENGSFVRGRPEPYTVAGLLSPAAVRNQVFTVVRLREGYDLAEVDRFLGQVEITLSRLLRENEELRAERHAAYPGDGSRDGAARLVEIVQEAADRTIALAHQEAHAILAEARERAERIEAEARKRAADLRQEARDLRHEALERRIDGLHAFIASFGNQMKETLDGQLGRLHNLLDGLQDPGDADTAALPAHHLATDDGDAEVPSSVTED